MHYKITTERNPAERSITFLLNGKFSEDALPDLDQSISAARCGNERIYVDLSEVTLVDRKAAQYLTEHSGRDLMLTNCPIYLERWITKVGDEAEN